MSYKLANDSQAADQYFGAVSLLLDGTDLQDKSLNTKTVTAYGDAQVSTAQSKFAGSSLYFDGTGDYLIADTDLKISNSNFTVEAWVNMDSTSQNCQITGSSSNDFNLFITSGSGILKFYNGGAVYTFSNSSISANTWTHVAMVREGTGTNETKIYLDGVNTDTVTLSKTWTTTIDIYVGRNSSSGSSYANGYIEGLRITKDVARYTAAFTPPAQPFIPALKTGADQHFYSTSLLIQGDGTNGSTNIVDSSYDPKTITANGNAQISTAQSKFGGSSLKFDGTGDYLTTPTKSAFTFNTNDFTIECWVYIAGNSSQNAGSERNATLVSTYPASGNITGYALSIGGNSSTTGTGVRFASYQSGSQVRVDATATVTQSAWHHVAVSRSGTLTKLFLDGSQIGSGTLGNQTISSNQSLKVGRLGYTGYLQEFNGYIDDLRITKGVARYISDFTPPTKALPDY